MMNKIVLKTLSTVALVGALSTTAVADEPQIGIGVGVAGQNSTTLRGTVRIEDNLRLEPFFGFSYLDPDKGSSSRNLELGSALHILAPINSKIRAYYGVYVGLLNYDYGNSNSGTVFNLGPVAGVEYAFDPHFTLGAEVRLNAGFGDYTTIGTDSAVLVRYYY